MTAEIVNTEQAEAWSGPEGEYWATHQARFDATIEPHHRQLMGAAAITPGERVLDIGCGNGRTSRDAARATGPTGSVLGVDLSAPMLARAQQLAKDEGLGNLRFQHADAQVHAFDPGAFDLVISRFGVMFFADPVAALANIAGAVRSARESGGVPPTTPAAAAGEGRLAVLVWQDLAANQWITVMRDALAVGRGLPLPPPGAPGPFAWGDPGFVTRTLTEAGFAGVTLEGSEQPFNLGTDADDAYAFAAGLNPVQLLLADLDEPTRARALDNLRGAMAAHETPEGVIFGSAAWIVTARRP